MLLLLFVASFFGPIITTWCDIYNMLEFDWSSQSKTIYLFIITS